VRGNGDGGIYSTAADITRLWRSLFTGRIVSAGWVAEMVRPHTHATGQSMRYGLGFWLHPSSEAVILEGFDAGVSFRSVHNPQTGITHTVISNSSYGAWPITRRLEELLATKTDASPRTAEDPASVLSYSRSCHPSVTARWALTR
jgi:CubicO group peptidase (beta-lactamase class C family)